MRTKTVRNGSAETNVGTIKLKARRKYSAEEMIRVVLDGLREELKQ